MFPLAVSRKFDSGCCGGGGGVKGLADRYNSLITRSGLCIDQFERTIFCILFSWSIWLITYLFDILRDLMNEAKLFNGFLDPFCP